VVHRRHRHVNNDGTSDIPLKNDDGAFRPT
jgi:hypothetical protein